MSDKQIVKKKEPTNGWWAVYSRYGALSEEECRTSKDAWESLYWGEEDGNLSKIGIRSPDGLLFLAPSYGREESVSQAFWQALKRNEVFIDREGGVTVDGEQYAIVFPDENIISGSER